MGFRFGRRSQQELVGVKPSLVDTTHRALANSPVDFSVHDGIRTYQEQEEYVASGVSHTMRSKHLKQEDGFGHAVDLVPYINGKMRWEWPPIYKVARAVYDAAQAEGVTIRWGAVWDRTLNELDPDDLEGEVEKYVMRRQLKGKKAFLDGPHFEEVT